MRGGPGRAGRGMTEVTQIRAGDAPEFREVLDSVCRERRHLAMLKAPPPGQVQSFVASNVRSGSPQVVAREDERIVGWCDVLPGPPASGMARAREFGLEKIELEVFATNAPAIGLYRGFGFREEGRRTRGRLVDGAYDDVLLMAYDLERPSPP